MASYSARAIYTIALEINDPDVIARALTSEWRDNFYDLETEQDVVQHLAYNLGIRGCRLSQLDGWADMADSAVEVISWDYEPDDD